MPLPAAGNNNDGAAVVASSGIVDVNIVQEFLRDVCIPAETVDDKLG